MKATNTPTRKATTPMQIFINLPVKNVQKSKAFFTKLGYTFDPQFTDKKAACLHIGENIYAMLIVEKFFKTFTPKRIADAKKSSEVLLALSVGGRSTVDDLLKKALKAGGAQVRETQDVGWMYSRAFEDLDGHIWELFYMDIAAMKAAQKGA